MSVMHQWIVVVMKGNLLNEVVVSIPLTHSHWEDCVAAAAAAACH